MSLPNKLISFLILLQVMTLGQAGNQLPWSPPKEYGPAPGAVWEPPAGYEKGQVWAPPADFKGEVAPWAPPEGFGEPPPAWEAPPEFK